MKQRRENKRSEGLNEDKKGMSKIILISIVVFTLIFGIILISALTTEEQNALLNELNSLENELSNSEQKVNHHLQVIANEKHLSNSNLKYSSAFRLDKALALSFRSIRKSIFLFKINLKYSSAFRLDKALALSFRSASPPKKSPGFLGPKKSSERFLRSPLQTYTFRYRFKSEGLGDNGHGWLVNYLSEMLIKLNLSIKGDLSL